MSGGAYHLGMVGLGTMGRNLLLNMADHGYAVAGYDKDAARAQTLREEAGDLQIGATARLDEFIAMLRAPRAVMMLVPAGSVVDAVIGDLLPHLQPGDVLIDGGNSFFKDTDLRGKMLTDRGLQFLGVGVSGGEAGARRGPSLMPGGPPDAYERVRPVFEAVAAKVGADPCVAYMGPGSAGHYVKMVHNGIEYGLMQLIAEAYDLMKRGLGLGEDDLHAVFARWNTSELAGYLIEITAEIFLKVDDRTGKRLVNVILDAAKQKGTGMWTSQNAMDLHVPIPTIDMAVAMRDLSGLEAERTAASRRLAGPAPTLRDERGAFVAALGNALYASMLLTYAQGVATLHRASTAYGYGIDLETVARIWRGGCIIRAAALEKIRAAYRARPDLPNLLLDPALGTEVADRADDLRGIVGRGTAAGIPVPGFAASLAYLDGYRSAWLPANLIQAQRDYFGAHTYERIDDKGVFHTEWSRE
ncbi:MAG TPA: NADP-dependent phosphogluconate dehydrogenase [bacterium]|nr:NADP-dependent phosphogluconate dehydrogenase [bacterium]